MSWSTSTWLALQAHAAPVGGGAHSFGAWEIATEMLQLDAEGGGEAPSSDEEGAATA